MIEKLKARVNKLESSRLQFGGVATTRKRDCCYREKKTEDSGMFPMWAAKALCLGCAQSKKVSDQGN